ncbi:hypothetical protein BDV29DRAFT_171795 [Aspergillus leporis]|uniref:Uncharacterized protein n=1 Tax=Aspergillus leporis TaxID=41062 RepID=A0A5N5X5X2_9EURO|nr:hypothetical protein BDV29DRAFT_171795 [Aspergillus leporis]
MTVEAPKHRCFRAQGGNLVKSIKEQIYCYNGDEALYKIVDIHILGYEWCKLLGYSNPSDNPVFETESNTTTFRVKTGEESQHKVDISGEFSGLKVGLKAGYSFEHKTFSEEETITETKHGETVKVKPHTAVYRYKKLYRFKVHVWYQLDAWNRIWTVGKRGKDELLEVLSTVEIFTNDKLQTGKEIVGTKEVEFHTVKRVAEQKNIKRLEDCTSRCQNYLRDQGIGGPWPYRPKDDFVK